MKGSLNDRILLGVDSPAEFMPLTRRDLELFTQTPDLTAMPDVAWSPIVPGGQDAFIFHDDGAYGSSHAGGAFGDQGGDIHKIDIPGRAIAFRYHGCLILLVVK